MTPLPEKASVGHRGLTPIHPFQRNGCNGSAPPGLSRTSAAYQASMAYLVSIGMSVRFTSGLWGGRSRCSDGSAWSRLDNHIPISTTAFPAAYIYTPL